MYTVTFYIGTGCNAINTADSLSKLASFASSAVTVNNCDIISCRNLSSFRVAKSVNDLKNADYCYVTGDNDSAVFSIQGLVPTSPDVCEVYVTIDYWLTAGGITNTTVLDGITERHHVPKSDDLIGVYIEEDGWILPSKPLQIADGGIKLDAKNSQYAFVESTLSLGKMGSSTALNAYTYTDTDTGETVTVPQTIPLNSSARTSVGLETPGDVQHTIVTPVTCYYNAAAERVQKGYQKCRDLGAEGAILNSWIIPMSVADTTQTDIESSTLDTDDTGRVKTIVGKKRIVASGLDFEYKSGVFNKRVFSGNLNKYVIQSVASGNMAEFNPEDLYYSGVEETEPHVVSTADLRPQGKPYFRFQYYKKSEDFWINCVPGLEWQTAPLVYYDKQGKTIDRTIFFAERANAAHMRGLDIAKSGLDVALGAGQTAFDIGAASLGLEKAGMGNGRSANIYNYRQAQQNMGSSIFSGVSNFASGIAGMFYDQQKYNIERENEKRRFDITETVVEPLIQYPREDTLRDFLGNGCRVYRYRYSDFDVAKVDKILTAYGYKDTAMLEPSFFTNRAKFNYIMAHGLSFRKDSIPKWIRDGMAAQIESGMRIWHVKPYAGAYTDNTNV